MNIKLQNTLLVLAFSALSLSAIAAGGDVLKENAACVKDVVVQAVIDQVKSVA